MSKNKSRFNVVKQAKSEYRDAVQAMVLLRQWEKLFTVLLARVNRERLVRAMAHSNPQITGQYLDWAEKLAAGQPAAPQA